LTNIPAENQPSDVLLLHGGALGDFVLAYHFACRFCDDSRRSLHVIARHPVARWFAHRGLIADARCAEQLRLYELFTDDQPPGAGLVAYIRRFTLILNLLDGPGGVVHTNLQRISGAEIISIDTRADPSSNQHILDQWLANAPRNLHQKCGSSRSVPLLVNSANFTITPNGARGFCRGTNRRPIRRTPDQPRLILHPGSGGKNKCAPLEHFESIRRQAQRSGYATAWMIGPDEVERDGHDLLPRLRASAPVILEESIDRACDLLAGADAYVGNDAGMTHVAALLDVSTTVYYVSTFPAVWRPIGRHIQTIQCQ